ncbi:MAG TPA: methyltransferase domain-containing protein [Solirubrobacterales bacterium]|nr:methyltransferase domain-containing protein [Solirubrobacterales bacterium]
MRAELAARYLRGSGLEIGAFNLPLEVPAHARVRYVDRMSAEDLRREYPEWADRPLPPVDVVDDGETLATIAPESQDFIVANHFLEHTEDPIGTIATHLGKLRPGGILFYAVPDKRYTFDFRRPVTSLEHMIRDHEEGPQRSRREHYDEWSLLSIEDDEIRDEPWFEEWALERARQLEAAGASIHTHVWTQASFLRLLLHCHKRLNGEFEIEAAVQNSLELVAVLRKRGEWPAPLETRTLAALKAHVAELEADVARGEEELRAVRSSPSWRLTRPLRTAKERLTRRR